MRQIDWIRMVGQSNAYRLGWMNIMREHDACKEWKCRVWAVQWIEKDLGLVSRVFNQEKIEKLKGMMAIGHTRYATAGTDDKRDIQPMVMGMPFGLGMAHNGNILNYFSLAKKLNEDFRQILKRANEEDAEANAALAVNPNE